jgi:hypothetical protein
MLGVGGAVFNESSRTGGCLRPMDQKKRKPLDGLSPSLGDVEKRYCGGSDGVWGTMKGSEWNNT